MGCFCIRKKKRRKTASRSAKDTRRGCPIGRNDRVCKMKGRRSSDAAGDSEDATIATDGRGNVMELRAVRVRWDAGIGGGGDGVADPGCAESASCLNEECSSDLDYPESLNSRSQCRMYGLLIQSSVQYLNTMYGDIVWANIRKRSGIKHHAFGIHNKYPEDTMLRIAQATSQILDISIDSIMTEFGIYFVSFVCQYGYGNILKVLGRNMRDFLNGLDNLHEYLRFTYKDIKPPSFFCEEESETGLTLHYRSMRPGYLHYVKGQIRQVGLRFYNTKVDIDILSETMKNSMVHVVMRLNFNNMPYKELLQKTQSVNGLIHVKSHLLFELFPFHVVFKDDMIIKNVGTGLGAILPDAVGKSMYHSFILCKPAFEFSWTNILMHTNSVFEMKSKEKAKADKQLAVLWEADETESKDVSGEKGSKKKITGNTVYLKGQMIYMKDWDCIMFLGTPVMDTLDTLFRTGLYINDLSMHDCSRDLVLAGTQQSAELKLALDQEQQKSKILEESMRRLDAEMKRTDSLLYQMIPKSVADRLRKGEPALNTCEVFDTVSILFSDVVGFTSICSKIAPMEVVSMLNNMYTKFDQLIESHEVYKVETIGDAYMAVSGAPTTTAYHALHICNMALDMIESMHTLEDPSTDGSMKIRIGVHSGTAVAGVVGVKMPRYCLFGDAVNTASRMETTSQEMKIHISEMTRNKLRNFPYVVQERESINVKGKGTMKTYWLTGKTHRGSCIPPVNIRADCVDKTANVAKEDGEADGCCDKWPPSYTPVTFAEVARSRSPVSPPSPGGPRPASFSDRGGPLSPSGQTKSPSSPKPGNAYCQATVDSASAQDCASPNHRIASNPKASPKTAGNSRIKKMGKDRFSSETCCVV